MEALASACAVRSLLPRTLPAMAPGPLKTKKTASVAPPPHLPTSRPHRAKTMCRLKLRNEVPAARNLALSCLPNRACKVNSLLRFFAISLNKQRSLSRCFDCEQSSPSARSRLAFSRRGPCVPSRSALWLRMLFIRFVNRAVQAVRRSHPRRAVVGKR